MNIKSEQQVPAPGTLENTTQWENTVSPTIDGEADRQNTKNELGSDQSSICRSPSWEGYGQKRKDKKKNAVEQRKKKKKLPEPEVHPAHEKKSTNRLHKTPPLMSPVPKVQQNQPPGFISAQYDSNPESNTKAGRASPLRPRRMSERWAAGVGPGLSSLLIRPLQSSTTTSKLLSANDHVPPSGTVSLALQLNNNHDGRPSFLSMDKISAPASNFYPPTSSRSHALRSVLPTTNGQQSPSPMAEPRLSWRKDKTSKPRLTTSVSDQGTRLTAYWVEHGRQSAEVDAASSSSYVQKTKDQSLERPITALHKPDQLGKSSHAQHTLTGTTRQQDDTAVYQLASPSLRAESFSDTNAPNSVDDDNAIRPRHNNAVESEPQSRLEQQPMQNHQQNVQHINVLRQQPLAKADGPDTGGDPSDVRPLAKHFSTPNQYDVAPNDSGSIFTSIKARMGRRYSASGGSTSNKTASRSFKERAIGAMNLCSNQSPNTVAALVVPSQMHSLDSSELILPALTYGNKNKTSTFALTSNSLRVQNYDLSCSSEANCVLGTSNDQYPQSSSAFLDNGAPLVLPLLTGTPDTPRTQPAKNDSATSKTIQIGNLDVSSFSRKTLTIPQLQQVQTGQARVTTTTDVVESVPNTTDTLAGIFSFNDDLSGHLGEVSSRGQLDENAERPRCSGLAEVTTIHSTGPRMKDIASFDNMSSPILSSPDLIQGLGILDKAWSQSTVTPDNDAQSFVTTLTNQKSAISLNSHFKNHKTAALLAEAQGVLGVHPALIKHNCETASGSAESVVLTEEMNSQNNKHCKLEERAGFQVSSTGGKHSQVNRHLDQCTVSSSSISSNPRTTSTNVHLSPSVQNDTFHLPKLRSRRSIRPSNRGQNRKVQPTHENEMLSLFSGNALSSSSRSFPGTRYLQEARRSVPIISSPLSSIIRSAKANMSTTSLARSGLDLRSNHSETGGDLRLRPPLSSSASASSTSSSSHPPAFGPRSLPAHVFRHEPERVARIGCSADTRPIAKMLVQCCQCNFFHDMPSRVYKCMAQPDTVVTDRDLGVSGAITTMVKCPWCVHNMSTKCCAGYAAVIYLKERMH